VLEVDVTESMPGTGVKYHRASMDLGMSPRACLEMGLMYLSATVIVPEGKPGARIDVDVPVGSHIAERRSGACDLGDGWHTRHQVQQDAGPSHPVRKKILLRTY
jgi:hypothetical protein